ncbi:MAG: hypothetical protein LC781_00795 [Actinobacteria bacterium]|nr:hypothetical protein [Actinomycetota bacterium]
MPIIVSLHVPNASETQAYKERRSSTTVILVNIPSVSQELHNRADRALKRVVFQGADLSNDQVWVGGEELAGPRVALDPQRPGAEVFLGQFDSPCIRVGVAGDLV